MLYLLQGIHDDASEYRAPLIAVGEVYSYEIKDNFSPYYEIVRRYPFDYVVFVRMDYVGQGKLNYQGQRFYKEFRFNPVTLTNSSLDTFFIVGKEPEIRTEATVLFEYIILRPDNVIQFTRVK